MAAVKAEQLTSLIQKRLKVQRPPPPPSVVGWLQRTRPPCLQWQSLLCAVQEDDDTDRNALKLAGLGKYMNFKMPKRVGEGKDALGNPLAEDGADAVEEGEIMDTDET